MGAYALIVALLVLLAGAVWVAVTGWGIHGDVEISGHGYAAMAIGIVFSIVIGCGLMTSVIHSSRHGYDDPAEHDSKKPK